MILFSRILLLNLLFSLFLVVNPAFSQEGHAHDHEEKGHAEKGHAHEQKAQEEGHDEQGHGHSADEKSQSTELSPQQMKLADIKVTTLKAQVMDYQIYSPGELKANGYTSYLVSPRVDSVVLRRHVALGEHVEEGQALVTLFSESMVDAQAAYLIALPEWLRVKKLGKKAVGAKRYVTAQTDYKAAHGRLIALGLTDAALKALVKDDATLGEYVLYAAIAGAVLSDDFHQGQRIGAGEELIELANESQLWVDASLPANVHLSLPAGTKALVKVGHDSVAAMVIQEAHTIDRETRTRIVRLIIDNPDDHLHAGTFADVFFSFKTDEPVLAVPESALIRSSDGDWTIFVEAKPGHFKAEEVTLGQSLGKWRAITGVAAGTRLVSEGAFFVASQIAKGGFDPHNH